MPIAVVSIPVRDQAQALDFYTCILGFGVLRDEPMGPTMRWVQLRPKDGGATIALTTWFETMPAGGVTGLMLHVADMDVEHKRLAELGAEVSPVDEQPWGRFTMLQDTDRNGWIVATLTLPEEIVSKHT